MPALRNKARFVAIPSTSGSASEITAFSVITDTAHHIKYPIVAADLVPDIAILTRPFRQKCRRMSPCIPGWMS
jgi:alcohol dehydrogenase class IV